MHINKRNIYPWIMWAAVAIFYAYRYLLEVAPAVMVPELMRAFAHNATLLGNLTAFYLYAYAGMQIPVGLILDRFKARRVLTMAVMIAALGSLIFAWSNVFWLAALGRFLSGLGTAFAAVGCMYIAAEWLPKKHFAMATGLVLAIGMLGAITGQAPLALTVTALGWRTALLTLGLLGLVIAPLVWILVRDKNTESLAKESINISLWRSPSHLFKNKQSWCLAIYGGLMFISFSVFGSLWGIPFLMAKYQIHNATAATLVTFLFLGLGVGSPFFGWWSNYINKRKIVLIIAALGTLFSITMLLYGPTLPDFINSALLFTFGFFTGGSFVAFAVILEINAGKNVGLILGFMNVLNMIGAAIGQPLAGWLLDLHWHAASVANVRIYDLTDYQRALTLLPVATILALALSFFIRETNCRILTIND